MRGRVLLIGTGLVVALALVSCGSSSNKSSTSDGGGVTVAPDATGTTVNVVLGDTKGVDGPMTMTVDKTSVPAGKVTFVVKNEGTITHEFVVLQPNVAFDAMEVTSDKVSEDTNVGEVGDVAKGETKSATIDLKAGSYVLVCNIAKHYGLGMRSAFTVT